jgi:hypothetical protein
MAWTCLRRRHHTAHYRPKRGEVNPANEKTLPTAVDPQRLGDFAGRLSPEELSEISVALRAVLDLE